MRVGTLAARACAQTSAANDELGADYWPVDFNDDQLAGGQDVLKMAPVFNSHNGDGRYGVRYDFNGDNIVGGADVLKFAPFFNKHCT
jgi:hypothetical protein